MSTKTTYLITGGNRGLGRGPVENYLRRPNNIVIATVRDAAHPTALSLSAVPVDSTTEHHITSLDVVIANAGISKIWPTVADTKIADMQEHLEVNVYGPGGSYKFVVMSSSAGSLGDMEKRNIPNTAYGGSKALLNYMLRKIHFENEELTSITIDPGWVRTDMGNTAARAFGMEEAEITVEQSINGVVDLIDNATRESASGKFLTYNKVPIRW
ncbi:hypothetical protein B0O99DRAFT_649022 [Bisporella sp. PMI_857]|nr:hypothetical protein B0O99DRAFT_649022 [Bisporella sp. PMI_857]